VLSDIRKIRDESKHIGDVRGRGGMMIGIEFVEDRKTKRPWLK